MSVGSWKAPDRLDDICRKRKRHSKRVPFPFLNGYSLQCRDGKIPFANGIWAVCRYYKVMPYIPDVNGEQNGVEYESAGSLEIDASICMDFKSSREREWLETNGIGGYASSTVSGANTRRYHALLVAATKPPLGRMALLSKYEEAVIINGVRTEISTNQYAGAVHPQGYRLLTRFRLDPFPVWTYQIDGVEIERSAFMVHGENTTVVRWRVVGEAADHDI